MKKNSDISVFKRQNGENRHLYQGKKIIKLMPRASCWRKEKNLRPLKTSHAFNLKAVFGALNRETWEHSCRVASLATRLVAHVRELNLPLVGNLVEAEVIAAALLHDIGKIGVSQSVLRKAGQLTASERCLLRCHPLIGQHLASALGGTDGLVEAIGQHHERWDGGGYPNGLAGESICLAARLISVVDAYDAITSRRCYSAQRSRLDALAILSEGAGTQWDSQAVDTLVSMLVQDCAPTDSLDMAPAIPSPLP